MACTSTRGILPQCSVRWTLDRFEPSAGYRTVAHLTYRGVNGAWFHIYLQDDGEVHTYAFGLADVPDNCEVQVIPPDDIPALIDSPDQLWDHVAWDRSDTHADLVRLGMV